MVEIIPAILTDSSHRFKELVRKLEPYTGRIHIDIADGILVPNKTVSGYEEIRETEAAVKFDVHLMVAKPQDLMRDWFHTHADRFIIHVESSVDMGGIVINVKNHNRKIGLALNPETEIDQIEQYLGDIDFVQFMTIQPGFQGQQFLDDVVDKISSFHSNYPDILIMCDGGITPETASRLVKAGASQLVVGSYIIKSEDIEKAIKQLKEAARN